jgi:hypothetical protein
MARAPRIATLCLLAGALLAAPAFLAPSWAPFGASPGPAAAAAQDADTPLDKALQQVEALLATLRGQPGADQKLVEKLEEIAANLRKEKEALAAKAPGAPPPATGVPPVDNAVWQRTRDAFLQGTDLKEDEKTVADQVLLEFVLDFKLAKDFGDDKSKAVIRDHTEKRIARTFGVRDANKMKENLADIIKFWDGNGGRRGK